MFKTIVWATDGSETADRALAYAKSLASGSGAKLFAVHCNEHFFGGRSSGSPVLADEDEIEAKIRGQVATAESEGIAASFDLVSGVAGHTAHVIADTARMLGADVIVVGTRGHAPVAGLLLGSDTQRLLHVASCPVLAVPPAATPAEPAIEAELAEGGVAR
jgi:nucleotide-binding universal stress UspA family protein